LQAGPPRGQPRHRREAPPPRRRPIAGPHEPPNPNQPPRPRPPRAPAPLPPPPSRPGPAQPPPAPAPPAPPPRCWERAGRKLDLGVGPEPKGLYPGVVLPVKGLDGGRGWVQSLTPRADSSKRAGLGMNRGVPDTLLGPWWIPARGAGGRRRAVRALRWGLFVTPGRSGLEGGPLMFQNGIPRVRGNERG